MSRYNQPTYFGMNRIAAVGDEVECFSDKVTGMRFRQLTIVAEVDEFGNIKVKDAQGWYNPKHFAPKRP